MDRRHMIGLSMAVALGSGPVRAAGSDDTTETITLWPGTPPGGEGLSLPPDRVTDHIPPYITPIDRVIDQVGTPVLNVLRPDRPDGSAMIIAPGGGYTREMLDFEGYDVARHFNAAGVTCFVLRYRLPGEGWKNRSDVPLQDAQRAMRLVRSQAARYAIDSARIGFMGFSAGGHLAASIATRFAAPVYARLDAADDVSARPDFSVPMYPVITMGEGCHAGSRDNLLGGNPTPALIDAYSCERHVPADAPPAFLALAADDTTVPPLPNAVAYFTALQAARIASEIHIFESGGHGFGIARAAGKPCTAWTTLLTQWARSHGFFRA